MFYAASVSSPDGGRGFWGDWQKAEATTLLGISRSPSSAGRADVRGSNFMEYGVARVAPKGNGECAQKQ
jgi:hypothetical protein